MGSMPDKPLPAVGIDLGTTYSVVARVDDAGRPTTIVNAEGELLTPSVVLFDGSDIVVGKEAVKALLSEPHHVAECAKRELGATAFHQKFEGQPVPPEVLEACILHKLRDDVRMQIGDFRQAVITVPAYFDEVRRKATQDAGYMAGLDVLDIVNEPTAAAIAFGYQQGFVNPREGSVAPQKLLVYDLGGGTFDVTVMELREGEFRTLATDGDVRLGGRDWDDRLIEFVALRFADKHGFDPRGKATVAARLRRECEDAKRTLSARPKANLLFDLPNCPFQLEVTREHFTELTHDLLDRTQFTARQVLRNAGLAWQDLDRVLLVGGSTRMPMVAEMLRELSGREPDRSIAADEAVAHGAALYASWLLEQATGKPRVVVRNVNSHSLGVVGIDRATRHERNVTLIPRNTPLPVVARRTFKTRAASQRSVLVRIVEGEAADPRHCTSIGSCTVTDLPADLPKGTPIEVAFHYRPDGRLTIDVGIEGTDRKLRHELARASGLNQADLDRWRERLGGNA